MLETITHIVTETLPAILIGWSLPLCYIALCFISHGVRRIREPQPPADAEGEGGKANSSAPHAPDLHPVLLGALAFRSAAGSGNGRNACSAALGALAQLIGTGTVSFAASHQRAPRQGADESDGPIVQRRRRRHSPSIDAALQAYGASLWLDSSHAHTVSALDAQAMQLIMPPGLNATSIATISQQMDIRPYWYRDLKRFLPSHANQLAAAGYVRPVGVLERVIFGPCAPLVAFSCLVQPALCLETLDPALGPVAVVMIIAVILLRSILVDLSPLLTTEGARVLGEAQDLIAWAELRARGARTDMPPRADAPHLLACLLAMDRPDLAAACADLFCRHASDEPNAAAHSPAHDGNHAAASSFHQMLLFCMRRPYTDEEEGRRPLSPAELILERADSYYRSITS